MAAVVAVAGVLTASATSASATFPGENGRVVFSQLGNVYTVDRDGTDLDMLTRDTGPGWFTSPTWSPDGSQIAFENENPRRHRLLVMDAEGTGKRRLPTRGARPTWSPDGLSIAFDGVGGIHIIPASGVGAEVEVTDSPLDGDPAWSPQGDWLVFQRARGVNDQTANLFKVRPDGTDLTQLTFTPGHESNPSWSADGSRIIFNRFRWGVLQRGFSMNPDGSDVTRLPHYVPTNEVDHAIVGSPDGQRLLFADSSGLWTERNDGSGLRHVLCCSAIQPDWQPV